MLHAGDGQEDAQTTIFNITYDRFTDEGTKITKSKYWRTAYSSDPSDMLYLYVYLIDWMVLNVQLKIFHAYLGRENISDVLYYSDTLSRIFNVLAHESNSPLAYMPLYPDTLFWLWADQ